MESEPKIRLAGIEARAIGYLSEGPLEWAWEECMIQETIKMCTSLQVR